MSNKSCVSVSLFFLAAELETIKPVFPRKKAKNPMPTSCKIILKIISIVEDGIISPYPTVVKVLME